MSRFNTYLDLCTQVYDLSKPIPPKEEYDFYRAYAKSVKGPILEPMCGTGRFLLPLVAEGFQVHGFDASDHMLDALHKKANEKNLNVKVWQGLIDKIKLSEKYDLIFIPSSSFCLITENEEAKNALKIFYDLLIPHGTLLFEIETSKTKPIYAGLWRGSKYEINSNKFIVANFLDLPLENNLMTTICRYELVENNNIVKTEIETLKVKLYDPDSLCSTLREIGFNKVSVIKAYDQQKEASTEDQVVIECKS